jgi:hypothetical protein
LEEYIPCRGVKEVSKHHDVAHRTTMDAGIAESARRAHYDSPDARTDAMAEDSP